MNRSKYIQFALTFFLVLGFALPAMAKDEGNLNAPLGTVKWGDSRKDVVKKVKEQLLEAMRTDNKFKGNRVLLQREHTRILNKVDEFSASYEKLDANAGYQVSVISDEFSRQNGESMMQIRDTVANRYYFFVDGGLYKMVVAYNQRYLRNVGFEPFVVQVAQKYGKPVSTDFIEEEDEDVLMEAIWTKGNTILTVKNQKRFFGTFTMAFAERSTAKRLDALRVARGDDKDTEKGLSARVESLTEISQREVDADIVDSIIGDSKINLNEGRPVDSQIARAEEEAAQKELAAKQAAEAKAKKKKKKTKKKAKKKSKRDFSDIESSDSGDDLIIY
ncbi:hypothetical protein [Bradymonas sediminis]|uniref:Uncharacterized protein n=1 Tax=Bradymonas sediminis TaxID=1548548 RepID=A0A2Z4FJ36_9DELT|nr:hypothetical protein [Bradymonas sediminis]AWV89041.1 hypothetical protein DN745_06685 [Bradymonas sediminis]TDP64500.1 hypothetical protein DFR33_109164 [Bradymonas sediminis]